MTVKAFYCNWKLHYMDVYKGEIQIQWSWTIQATPVAICARSQTFTPFYKHRTENDSFLLSWPAALYLRWYYIFVCIYAHSAGFGDFCKWTDLIIIRVQNNSGSGWLWCSWGAKKSPWTVNYEGTYAKQREANTNYSYMKALNPEATRYGYIFCSLIPVTPDLKLLRKPIAQL